MRADRSPAPWVVLSVVALGACLGRGNGDPAEMDPGEDVLVEGPVMEVDVTPMFVDGDGEMRVMTAGHKVLRVRVPARERLCPAEGLELFPHLQVGDTVRVRGRVTAPYELTVCEADSHFLLRLSMAGGEADSIPVDAVDSIPGDEVDSMPGDEEDATPRGRSRVGPVPVTSEAARPRLRHACAQQTSPLRTGARPPAGARTGG